MRNDDSGVWQALFAAVVVVVCLIVVVKVLSDDENGRELSPAGPRVSDTLKFLVVVSRHGNRGGIADYVNDPYPLSSPHYWPYGPAGLTPQGRVQMYKLGVRVRSLYDGFLNSTFHPEELHASSTYMDRVLMSGEAFLAGLYPPNSWQLWNNNISWQPTPLYSDSPDNTPFIMDCPRYSADMLVSVFRYCNDSGNMALIRELLDRYSLATGQHITDPIQLMYLWDKLVSEETEGYTVPAWTALLYPDPLVNLVSDLYLLAFAGTDEMINLLIVNLYGILSEVLSSKADGTMSPRRRLQYYSGHDSSIVALQVLLEVSLYSLVLTVHLLCEQVLLGVPPSSLVPIVKPGSALLLELHEHPATKFHSVQLLYIDGGSADLDLSPLPLTGCGDPCALSFLLHNTVKYIRVLNFTDECTLSISGSNSSVTDDVNKQFRRFILKYTN